MNERFKELRKALGMNMEEFGTVLGISKSGVSEIENGRRSVTNQHIRILVTTPINGEHVSEQWLRTGEGEMFVPRTKNQVITDFMADLVMEDDSFKKRIIEALAQLDAKDWEELERIALKVLERKNGEQD